MSLQPVEAAFFWRYLDSPFRATYGRLPGNTYTKDYLQSPGEQWAVFDRVFGRKENEKVTVVFKWPSGLQRGEFRKSAADERGQLAWETNHPPIPWKVGDPYSDASITIPGDPTRKTEREADVELQRLKALKVEPWIVAIKLVGEGSVLHTRAYLDNPPKGLEHKSIQELPQTVREAIKQLPRNKGGGAVVSSTLRSPNLARRIIEALRQDPNVLLVGPPGTGKTVVLEDLRALFQGSSPALLFDPERWHDAWDEITIPPDVERKAVSLVFHPSYSYEEFVAGLVPQADAQAFKLIARPGPLLSLAHWAADPGRMALLVLDEFNRGSAAAIFGDTLALLDGTKRDDPSSGHRGATIQRPYPLAEMKVGEEYKNSTGAELKTEVSLPKSLWILAAFNSTDRSVAPVDAALRRRFAIIQVPPDYEALAQHLGTILHGPGADFKPSTTAAEEWTAEDVKQLTLSLLITLNHRINFVLGQDFLLGHALFWSVEGSTVEELAKTLSKAFDERIASTLRLTFLDQDEALGAILNAGSPPLPNVSGLAEGGGIVRWITPPASLQGVATARLEFQDASSMEWPQALRALSSLL